MENAAIMATSFALIASVFWAFGDFWAAKASKAIGATAAAYYTNLLGTLMYVTIFLLVLRPDSQWWSTGTIFAGIGGCLVTLAFYIFCRGLVAGPVSAVIPISAAYPLFTTITALAVFDASLSGIQIAAILVIVAGIMAISGLFTLDKSERRLGRGPALGILSAVIFGIGFALVAQGVDRIGWQAATFAQTVSSSLFFVIILLPLIRGKERVFHNFRKKIAHRVVVLQSVAGVAGLIALNVAFSFDVSSGAIVSAISACYPLLSIWLALKHFKEEVRFVPLLGAAASIAGLVVLSLG